MTSSIKRPTPIDSEWDAVEDTPAASASPTGSEWDVVEDIPAASTAQPTSPMSPARPPAMQGAPASLVGSEWDTVEDIPAVPDGAIVRALKRATVLPLAKIAIGAGETATQMVTGVGAAAAGTVAGVGDAVPVRGRAGDANRFPETFRKVAEDYTYQPRTETGKALSKAVAWPFEKAEELGAAAGEAVFETTDSPGAATAANVGVAAVPYAAGYALGMRGRRASKTPEPIEGESARPTPTEPTPEMASEVATPRAEPMRGTVEQPAVKPVVRATEMRPESPMGAQEAAEIRPGVPHNSIMVDVPLIEAESGRTGVAKVRADKALAEGEAQVNRTQALQQHLASGKGLHGGLRKLGFPPEEQMLLRTRVREYVKEDGFDTPTAVRMAVDDYHGELLREHQEIIRQIEAQGGAPQKPATVTKAPDTATNLPPFPREADLRQQAHEKKAREHGLTAEQASVFAPEKHPDPLTGFQARRDREPTLRRAMKYADETGQPGHYVALDIKNLGGLNARLGEPGADKVFKALTAIGREELEPLGGHVNLFRHGGDEVSAVVLGLDEPALAAALARISDRGAAYAVENGLAEIPHTKAGRAPGTGVNFSYAPLVKGSTLEDVLELAHNRLERAKEARNVYAQLSGEARSSRPGEQAGGMPGVHQTEGRGDRGEVRQAPAAEPVTRAGDHASAPTRQVTPSKPATNPQGSPEPPRRAHSVGAMEAKPITPQTRLGDALDSTMEPVKKLGKEVADVTGAKSISYLDDLAKTSPTAKKLRDTIEYTEFSKEPIPPSFYERVSLKTGELAGRMENTLDSLRGVFRRKLPEEVNAALVAALRGEKPAKPVPGIADAAARIRDLLIETRRYANEQGLEIGFIPNYFPRVYKRKVLESDKGRAEFIKVLQRHGIEATEADAIAAKIVNTDGILAIERAAPTERINPAKPRESNPFRMERMLKAKARVDKNIETARTLARIPDAELAPFLESNVPAVLTKYLTGVIRRAEYARAFGPGEGRLNRMVRDIVIEAAQGGRPMRPAEIQRIYGLADAMQGAYHPIMSSVGRAANNFVTAYQYLRTLPLATLSSLSEPFLVLARGRPGTIPRAIARALNHSIRETLRSVYRKFPKAEATKALEDVGLGLDAALSERLTASFGGEVTKFTTAFFKLNFLHQFTRFNRVLANEAGKLMVERHLKDLGRGVSPQRTKQIERELAELGVDADQGLAWVKRGAPKEDAFSKTIKAAGLRFTNEVVMNPRPTNRPLWHSNPHFHLLAQLKGFQTVFGNTVLTRWYDMIAKRGVYEGTKNAAKIATAGVLMTYTAMLGNELREYIKHGPGGNPKFRDEDPAKSVYRAMERAGFLGVFQFVSDAMFAHRFGSPAIAQIAGPAASQINEIIEAAGKATEGKERPLAKEAINAIPLANVVPSVRTRLTDVLTGVSEDERELIDLKRRIGDTRQRIKELRQEGEHEKAAEIEKREKNLLQFSNGIEEATREGLGPITKEIERVKVDQRMDPDKKKAKLEKLEKDRDKFFELMMRHLRVKPHYRRYKEGE